MVGRTGPLNTGSSQPTLPYSESAADELPEGDRPRLEEAVVRGEGQVLLFPQGERRENPSTYLFQSPRLRFLCMLSNFVVLTRLAP